MIRTRNTSTVSLQCLCIAATLGLVFMTVAVPLQSREFPAFYERDYESAEKLNELYEKLEAADALLMLDSTNDAIVGGVCRSQDQSYRQAYGALEQYRRRPPADGSLSEPERSQYERLQRAETESWSQFEKCFDGQITRPVFANTLPPGVTSYESAIALYDRLLREHPGEFTEGQVDANIAQIEADIQKIEDQKAYVASVTSVFRDARL
ncbi:MAG: hypothetical protein AAGG55_00515 [Pseudomonadota bacterium]